MSERSLAARLQSAASTQFAGLRAAGRVCTNTSGDAGMKKASTRLLEQETQTPSPAPDLIPAESSTENLHWDWYSKRGHFRAKWLAFTPNAPPIVHSPLAACQGKDIERNPQ